MLIVFFVLSSLYRTSILSLRTFSFWKQKILSEFLRHLSLKRLINDVIKYPCVCKATSDNMSRKIDDEPCCYKKHNIFLDFFEINTDVRIVVYYIIVKIGSMTDQISLPTFVVFRQTNFMIKPLHHHLSRNELLPCIVHLTQLKYVSPSSLRNYHPTLVIIMAISCVVIWLSKYKVLLFFYLISYCQFLGFRGFYIISFLWLYYTSCVEAKDICYIKRITSIR